MDESQLQAQRVPSTKEAALTSSDEQSEKIDPQTAAGRDIFLNRELTWLEFNERVLTQAADQRVPLLERVRFISIFSSNLDEFFMKRVGSFKRQIAAGIEPRSLDGMTPKQQLRAIRERTIPLTRIKERVYLKEIIPELKENSIELLRWEECTPKEKQFGRDYFFARIFPLLTPLAVDSGHPFPFISNLSTSLGVALSQPEREETLFARVKISGIHPQWILIGEEASRSSYRFISVKELVTAHLEEVFPKMTVLGSMAFRVTRNAELDIDEDEAADMLELIEQQLRQRRFGQVVRLQHGPNPDPWILNFLTEELNLHPHDIYEKKGELDYTDLNAIVDLDLPDLKYGRWTPTVPSVLIEEASIFSILRSRNLLVHHPYESFSASVERFVREAATDRRVQAIKMTVYRVGDETPLIPLLIKAAENGKHVVVLVELQARFDEERNIQWAQTLEEAGVHVMYGIPGLKTHAKTLLVIREEAEGIRAYAHCGTGNYHAKTANLYTDFGLFTADPEYTKDLLYLFNYLTGRSLKDDYGTHLIAPISMEDRFLDMIDQEIENIQEGKPASIIAKMNSLEDRHVIRKLYEASQAGVPVDLIVRGFCCLKPGVPGLSENIRVHSIIGRLLEHSRLYYFRSGAEDPIDGQMYISSADWMSRNLHRRVEIATPMLDRGLRERIWEVLQVNLADKEQGWQMNADGSYFRKESPPADAPNTNTFEVLMEAAREMNNAK